MSSETTFPCIACGAPIEPEINRDYMARPYCGTNLQIPKSLRRKVEPLKNTRANIPESGVVVNVPDLLRRAQAVAAGALNLLFIYNWIKRLIPACLAIVIVFFFLCIVAGSLLAALRGS